MDCIDASVAVKWFKANEENVKEAYGLYERIRRGESDYAVNEWLALEVVSGLLKANVSKENALEAYLNVDEIDGGAFRFRSNGGSFRALLDCSEAQAYVLYRGREVPVEIETRRDRLLKLAARGASSAVHHAEIRAAMPGLVVRINANVGDQVKKGDSVLILEAMKMENEVRAPVDGTIGEIRAVERGSVEKGDVLVVFE